ncbi:MAG TPA: DUF3459 domain-containing protein, partial [Nocardioidaceae bacterium]|nr:DUF3459 domain-containing protein [Nocardioidaceae bacterium]
REPHRRILELYRDLIALRAREPELTDPRFDLLSAETGDGWFRLRQGDLHVVVNLGEADWDAGPGEVLLASSPRVTGTILPPDTAAVLRSVTNPST